MQIIESIYKEPERWRHREHTLVHEDGFELWIANGRFSCQPWPQGGFNLIQKWKAWKAYRWWVKNAPMEAYAVPRHG